MDIHAPDSPVHSAKQFAVHLAIVTIGILIALTLEGIMEWHKHRELVSEAKANLRRELTDNEQEVRKFLEIVKQTESDYEGVPEVVARLRAGQVKEPNYHFRFYSMQLSDAAWTTAQASGAVVHMEYEDIQRFARIYATQAKLTDSQNKFMDSMVSVTPDADPTRWSEQRFETWKEQVHLADVRARAEEHVAARLLQEYGRAR